MKTLLGRKIGMTQIFTEEGDVVPVTVIEAGPETVTQVKTMENDGYEAVQIGFEDQKAHRVTKPMAGHFEKAGVSAKKVLAEFRPEEGESYIWSVLGFDVCNSALWFDDAFAFDESNQYNTFFRVKPYEVLQELANNDAIGTIYTTSVSPTLNDYMCTTTLNEVFEDGMDVDEALAEAQEYLEMELM